MEPGDGAQRREREAGSPSARAGRARARVGRAAVAAGPWMVGLLAVLAGWRLSAGAPWASASHATILLLAACGAEDWRDPLCLGRRGRWLAVAWLALVGISCWASPVPRAGWTVVALLPAWLLVPAGLRRSWDATTSRADRPGPVPSSPLAGWLAAVGVVLLIAWAHLSPRASAPLGHHNLLALWLLAALPLVALAWRHRGPCRVAVAVLLPAGLVTLGSTRSLSGAAGLVAAVVLALLLWHRLRSPGGPRAGRGRWWAAAAVLLALGAAGAVAVPRLAAVLAGDDPSFAARSTYWAAGLEGLAARPALGWGPGSTPWTLAEWLRRAPGVNPPQEMVGDLHSQPLALLYELGVAGLLLPLAMLAVFLRRRWRELGTGRDPLLAAAGLVGLVGVAVGSLGVAPAAVPAVVAVTAFAASATLAGCGATPVPGGAVPVAGWRARGRRAWPAWLWLAGAGLLLVRLDAAHLHYDRSLADAPGSWSELAAAVRLDPRFPLYRAHLAAAGAGGREGDGVSADQATEALLAAEEAVAVPSLWLLAGDLARRSGELWSGIALERACRLDALGPAAPFFLGLAADDLGHREAAARSVARSLLAEPRLAAAVAFDRRPGLRAAAVGEVLDWPGLSRGWRVALAEQVSVLDATGAATAGDVTHLRLTTGGDLESSLAFHTFRRQPRRLQLAAIPVHRGMAASLTVPPAAILPETSADAFGARGCTPSEVAFAAP